MANSGSKSKMDNIKISTRFIGVPKIGANTIQRLVNKRISAYHVIHNDLYSRAYI